MQALLYAIWAWLFICLGLCIAVLGPSIPEFRKDFAVSLGVAGALFTVHSAGYFGGVLVAGPLADRKGRRLVTGVGAAALLAGTALAALAPAWGWFLGAMVPSGIGFAFVDVGLNSAIGDAVVDERRRAAAMNLLHGAFPLGTLAAPAALALALTLGQDWRMTFLAIAVFVAVALMAVLAPRPAWPAHAAPEPRHVEAQPGGLAVLSLLREPHLARLALLQALYVGAELGIAGWIATYLVDAFGASAQAGALSTSLYWGGFLVGRPLMAYAAHRIGPARLLPWEVGVGIVTAVVGIFAPGGALAAGAFALTGLAISGVFPTAMSLALNDRRGDTGAATALITAAAAVGGFVWPWLVGVVADQAGLRAAMGAAALPLLVMLPLSRSALDSPQ